MQARLRTASVVASKLLPPSEPQSSRRPCARVGAIEEHQRKRQKSLNPPRDFRLFNQHIPHQLFPHDWPGTFLLCIFLDLRVHLFVVVIRVHVVSHANKLFLAIRSRDDDYRDAKDLVCRKQVGLGRWGDKVECVDTRRYRSDWMSVGFCLACVAGCVKLEEGHVPIHESNSWSYSSDFADPTYISLQSRSGVRSITSKATPTHLQLTVPWPQT